MKQCANAATRAKIKQSVSNVITKVIKKRSCGRRYPFKVSYFVQRKRIEEKNTLKFSTKNPYPPHWALKDWYVTLQP